MNDETIPGLVVDVPGTAQDGPMAKAAAVSIRALVDAKRLEARHQVLVQLVHSLAGAIDKGVQSGRASAVAMAAKQLLDTMVVLDPPPEDGTDSERFARELLAEFHRKAEELANQADTEGGP
jgi:hypothetical protein